MLRDPGTVSALQLIDIRFSYEVELKIGIPFLYMSFLTIFVSLVHTLSSSVSPSPTFRASTLVPG